MTPTESDDEQLINITDESETEQQTAAIFPIATLVPAAVPHIVLPTNLIINSTNINDMDLRAPVFEGSTPDDSPITFSDNFDQFVATRTMTPVHQLNLLKVSFRGPAKTAFTEWTPANGANEAEQIVSIKQWLRDTYHTAEVQQGIKDQLDGLFQQMNENPQSFYTRIRHLITLAGYPPNVQDLIAENIFIKGIHQEIAIAIKSTPEPLNLNQKIRYAQRIWSARNPTYSQAFRPIISPEPIAPPRNVLRRGEESRTIRTDVPQVQVTPKEDPIDALTKQIAQLSINLLDMQKRPRYLLQAQAYQAN